MPLEAKMTKVPKGAEDEHRRCTAMIAGNTRPCVYYAEPNVTKCLMHGAVYEQAAFERETQRSYKLANWQSEMDRIGKSDGLKSLRDEIVISRLTLQGILSQCDDQFDLMMNAPKIAMMLEKIQGLVVNCNKLENSLGLVLDKSAILNLAEQIVQIVGEHVSEETQALIADKIADAVEASGAIPIKQIG